MHRTSVMREVAADPRAIYVRDFRSDPLNPVERIMMSIIDYDPAFAVVRSESNGELAVVNAQGRVMHLTRSMIAAIKAYEV